VFGVWIRLLRAVPKSVLWLLEGNRFAPSNLCREAKVLGLPELITRSLDEYEDVALQLARHPDQLADLWARLEANRKTSSLFDGEQFARNLDKAYVVMWEIHTSGDRPQAFAVSPT
jgi:predicted O-linked N-acetylglucosamine transferase (SPINDLY family)